MLTDRGLEAALQSLADWAPFPVEIAGVPPERFDEALEAAVYLVVAESLTNVVKYAEASSARVEMSTTNDLVAVAVHDDGRGGATPGAGTGLRGLADRLEALGGRLDVRSPVGAGTVVRASTPTPPRGLADGSARLAALSLDDWILALHVRARSPTSRRSCSSGC